MNTVTFLALDLGYTFHAVGAQKVDGIHFYIENPLPSRVQTTLGLSYLTFYCTVGTPISFTVAAIRICLNRIWVLLFIEHLKYSCQADNHFNSTIYTHYVPDLVSIIRA